MIFFSFFVSCFATGLSTLSGSVHVTGNEPHTVLVLVTADGKRYRITGALEKILRDTKQNQAVTLNGTLVKESAAKFAPGEFDAKEILPEK